jgi:hypothetical protein
MRALLIFVLLNIFLLPELNGQEKNNGPDITFSLIHPVKHSLNQFKYSVDPTLEVLYFTSLSKKFWVAGGLLVQTGKHNWLALDGHTFYDDFGMPYRFRTDFNRQLEFFSLGILVKFGMEMNSAVINSLIVGFTAGNHLKLEEADYYNSEFVANIPVTDFYNSLFWDLNFGFRKVFYHAGSLTLSLAPVAGYRKETSRKGLVGYYNYVYYGLGINARLKR